MDYILSSRDLQPGPWRETIGSFRQCRLFRDRRQSGKCPANFKNGAGRYIHNFFGLKFFKLILILLCLSAIVSRGGWGGNFFSLARASLPGEEEYKSALNFFKKKEYQQAWEILKNLQEDALPLPLQADLFFLKGHVLYQLSKYPESAQAFSRAATVHPLLADYALYYQGEAWQKAGAIRLSLEIYQRLISQYPESLCISQAELKMAEIYLQLQEYEQAKDICLRALSRNLSKEYVPSALFLLAQAQEGLQAWEKAIQTYQEIWLKYPLNNLARQSQERWLKIAQGRKLKIERFSPPELLQRALHFYRARLYETTLQELEKIPNLPSSKYPKNYKGESWIDEFYFYRGMSYFYLKQYPKAKELFNLVNRYSRNELLRERSSLWLIRSLYRGGRKELALEACSRFKNSFPQSSLLDQVLYIHAQLLEERGEINNAVALYQEIGTKFPQSSLKFPALWQAGWLYFKNREWGQAVQVWEQLRSLSPNSPWIEKIYYWLGRAWQEMKEYAKAEENFQYLLRNYPSSLYALLVLGKGQLPELNIYFSAPLEEKILKTFLETTDRVPALIHLEKGKALSRLGLISSALLELTAAEEKGKTHPDFQKEISRIYREMGEYGRSAALVRKLFRLQPLTPTIPPPEKSLYLLAYPVGNLSWINYYSQRRNLDPALLCALILEESRFNQQALSVAGARGLMQIIPRTGQQIARQLNVFPFQERMLFDPEFNLLLGTWYLAHLLQEFSGKVSLALAAYNAGPQAVKEWLAQVKAFREDEFIENIPYSETRHYVIKVLNNYQVYRTLYRSSP